MSSDNKKIVIEGVNLQNFRMFIDSCEASESSHVFEIADGKLQVRAMPNGKEFIKHTNTDMANIGTVDTGGKLLKITYGKLKNLKNAIDIFISRKNTEGVKIEMVVEEDMETKGALISTSFKIVHSKQKSTISGAEPQFTNYMSREIWGEFSNTTEYKAKFDLTSEDIKHITDSTVLEVSEKSKGINSCKLVLEEGKPPRILSHKKNVWEFELQGNYDVKENLYINLPMKALKEMTGVMYELFVVNTKMPAIVAVENEDNKILYGYGTFNPAE